MHRGGFIRSKRPVRSCLPILPEPFSESQNLHQYCSHSELAACVRTLYGAVSLFRTCTGREVTHKSIQPPPGMNRTSLAVKLQNFSCCIPLAQLAYSTVRLPYYKWTEWKLRERLLDAGLTSRSDPHPNPGRISTTAAFSLDCPICQDDAGKLATSRIERMGSACSSLSLRYRGNNNVRCDFRAN